MEKKHIVVSTTGVTSRELLEARKRQGQTSDSDFLTVGGMGHASQIALAQQLINRTQNYLFRRRRISSNAYGFYSGRADSEAVKIITMYYSIMLFHDSVGGQPIGAQSIDFLNVAKSSGFKNLVRIEKRHRIASFKRCI